MQNLINKQVDVWERPWDIEKFDNLYNRDERFFALVIKGALSWLNNNLRMYGRPIRHFIFNTGSSYLYLENTGYEYNWCETTGEDLMYMETPRCLVSIGSFNIPTEELTSPYIRGEYERISNAENTKGQILGYTAEIQRLPIEMTLTLKYTFSTFNEAIIFIQELIENVSFQQYFDIIYLGQIIKCSIEINADTNINLQDIDLSSKDVNQRTMQFDIKVTSNLPVINTKTEIKTSQIIGGVFAKVSDKRGDLAYIKHGEINEGPLLANEIIKEKLGVTKL